MQKTCFFSTIKNTKTATNTANFKAKLRRITCCCYSSSIFKGKFNNSCSSSKPLASAIVPVSNADFCTTTATTTTSNTCARKSSFFGYFPIPNANLRLKSPNSNSTTAKNRSLLKRQSESSYVLEIYNEFGLGLLKEQSSTCSRSTTTRASVNFCGHCRFVPVSRSSGVHIVPKMSAPFSMSMSMSVPRSSGQMSTNTNFSTLYPMSPPNSLSLSTLSSSPSACGSLTPTSSMYNLSGETSDDIVALSAGFDRKRTLRRRLSTAAECPGAGDGHGHSGSGSGQPDDRGDRDHRDRDSRLIKRKDSISEVEETLLAESQEIAVPGLDQLNLEDEESATVILGAAPAKSTATATVAKLPQILTQLDTIIGYSNRSISQMIVEKAAKELCTAYDELEDPDKYEFFNVLAEKYYVDHGIVKSLSKSISECNEPNTLISLQDKLRSALVPKYQWLFSQIGRLEGGVKFLVDFRTDLSELTQKYSDKSSPSSSHLKAMNSSLKDLISAWFGVGFLNLERVTWQSPCDMLQKISEYEAVHPMRNWTDLKRRVGNYRRCFVYTHGSMKGEPVVVLHTALTDHIPSGIGSIVVNSRMRMMSVDSNADLSSASTGIHEDARNITTAIFYSITSTQKGLAGIELGNYLIKRVVRELQKEFPKISIFSSLSPIPGFRSWLISELKSAQKSDAATSNPNPLSIFTPSEIKVFEKLLGVDEWLKKLQILISQNDWADEEELADALENFLMRQCAKYLVCVKRRGFAMNSVAHFHLKNGAVIWRLNWKANLKPRGLTESCGIMVNYRYFLDDCESNSQNYMEKQEIKISDTVKHLVKLATGTGNTSTNTNNGNSQPLSKI